jgi:hypothetical protein
LGGKFQNRNREARHLGVSGSLYRLCLRHFGIETKLIEGFSLVEKFQNEDAVSDLFQISLDSDTTPGNSIQTSQTQERPGMDSIEWEWEWG